MASLTLRDIKKSFNNLAILKGVSLDVKDGEFVILVGPSGCGKSTLLRMIAGLDRMDDGDILIGDRLVNEAAPKDRDIAMVFQNYALYPHMSVRHNMSFGLKMMRVPSSEITKRVDEAARILGLTPLLERKPRDLSGGQRQRVAMGRAIVRHPQVFLFDEPLSNLDAQLRVQMRTEIRDLQRRLNVTSIYVTHDQVEAMTMADKIVIMNAGVVEQIGSPLEVYDFPRNKFVAGFIGSPQMNFVDGTAAADKPLFRAAAGLELPLGASHTVSPGRAVTYGIRPEHISIGTEGTEAIVHLVENTGHETLVHFEAQDVRLSALMTERPWFKEGETIRFSLDGAHAHLFDAKTGFTIAGAGAAS